MTDHTYKDDDLVYVDPKTRTVVGFVEWSKDGKPLSKEMPDPPEEEGEEKGKRKRKKRNFPWGTYKSMKKIYRLEGKEKEEEGNTSLDEAIKRAMDEPYWD